MTRLMLAFAIFCGITLPARADDTALKTEIEQLGASYMECYSKKDAACIAAHYTPEGIHAITPPRAVAGFSSHLAKQSWVGWWALGAIAVLSVAAALRFSGGNVSSQSAVVGPPSSIGSPAKPYLRW